MDVAEIAEKIDIWSNVTRGTLVRIVMASDRHTREAATLMIAIDKVRSEFFAEHSDPDAISRIIAEAQELTLKASSLLDEVIQAATLSSSQSAATFQ